MFVRPWLHEAARTQATPRVGACLTVAGRDSPRYDHTMRTALWVVCLLAACDGKSAGAPTLEAGTTASAKVEASAPILMMPTVQPSTAARPESRREMIERLKLKTRDERRELASACTGLECTAVIGAAQSTEETDLLTKIAGGRAISEIAKQGKDGPEVSLPATTAALILGALGPKALTDIKPISYGEAKKDPDAARGMRVDVSGTVISIKKHMGQWMGTISLPTLGRVEFSSFESDGIVEGAKVKFSGVFVQIKGLPNMPSSLQSVVLAGVFVP